MTAPPKALYSLREDYFEAVYGAAERTRIAELVNVATPLHTPEMVRRNPGVLADVEVLITGWGGLRLDAEVLSAAPQLRAVFHGGGSLAPVMTRAAWDRDLIVTSAAAANAVAVAEFAVSVILLSLKGTWRAIREMQLRRGYPAMAQPPGVFDSRVGLVSLGAIGRAVAERLRAADVDVVAYDPFVSRQDARACGVTLVSLAELFRTSDVVSVHTPQLPETQKLIRAGHLESLMPGATLVNTARGEVIDEAALVDVARRRPDLQMVLDVTAPSPPAPGSPLYDLPNVVLTPHIAGSCGRERRRLGMVVAEELARYVRGEPLRWQVTREAAWRTSHRGLEEELHCS